MAPVLHITEDWLQTNVSLAPGGEVHLPCGSRLTPSARDLLSSRKIRIRFLDEVGRVFVEAGGKGDALSTARVHALTGSAVFETAHCQFCGQDVKHKPEAATHLNASTLVAKNDPRIAFRGRVDSAIAQAVLLQAEWRQADFAAPLQRMLADLRSALGNVLRAEAVDAPMPEVVMGEFDAAKIHALSHDPLKYLGHDHVVPAVDHGITVLRLNVLRAAIREAEVAGAQAFIDRDFKLARGDVLEALNRLSSAVYVLMLICLCHEKATGGA